MVTLTVWKSELPAFLRTLDSTVLRIHNDVVTDAEDSIVFGSALTGAPGQPDDLRQGQWKSVQEGELDTLISTDDNSAPAVEDGISRINGHPIVLDSAIGGLHSVGLTQLNGDRLIKRIVARYAKA